MIDQRRQYLDNLFRLLVAAGKNRFEQSKSRLSLLAVRLDALSPLNILARGYSVTRIPDDGAVIKSSRELTAGQRVETILAQGRFISRVEKQERGKR